MTDYRKPLEIHPGAHAAAVSGQAAAAKALAGLTMSSPVESGPVANVFDAAVAELSLEMSAAATATSALIHARSETLTAAITNGFPALAAMDEANQARLERV